MSPDIGLIRQALASPYIISIDKFQVSALCDEIERLRAEKGQHPNVESVRDYHAALTNTREDLEIAVKERERLRAIVLRQGVAIDEQRKRNHNVEKARSKWRKRAENSERETNRLWKAILEQAYYIEQSVAELFPDQFPLYPEDWNAGTDRCVGEHTPESLVLQACNEIRRLRIELKECYRGD